jgi:hypothetical protein
MFYLFKNKPDVADMEARGSDINCVPQMHMLKTGEVVWLVSGNINTDGLDVEYEFSSPEQCLLWQAIYCESEVGEI